MRGVDLMGQYAGYCQFNYPSTKWCRRQMVVDRAFVSISTTFSAQLQSAPSSSEGTANLGKPKPVSELLLLTL